MGKYIPMMTTGQNLGTGHNEHETYPIPVRIHIYTVMSHMHKKFALQLCLFIFSRDPPCSREYKRLSKPISSFYMWDKRRQHSVENQWNTTRAPFACTLWSGCLREYYFWRCFGGDSDHPSQSPVQWNYSSVSVRGIWCLICWEWQCHFGHSRY